MDCLINIFQLPKWEERESYGLYLQSTSIFFRVDELEVGLEEDNQWISQRLSLQQINQ